jgi:hypothetical protein
MNGEYSNVNDTRRSVSHRPLLVPAVLAAILDAALAGRGIHFVDRAALAAFGLDAGLALLDGEVLFRHGLFDQPFGFRAHFLFRHISPLARHPLRNSI